MFKSLWRSVTDALVALLALLVARKLASDTLPNKQEKPPKWTRCTWCARPINRNRRHVCGESLPLEGN